MGYIDDRRLVSRDNEIAEIVNLNNSFPKGNIRETDDKHCSNINNTIFCGVLLISMS